MLISCEDEAGKSVPIRARAVLYEEVPNTPLGERHIGVALWSTVVRPATSEGAQENVVVADIEIPGRDMGVSLEFRHNEDKSLPATHTLEVRFRSLTGSVFDGIQRVTGLTVKSREQSRGDILAGPAAKVVPGIFLLGLSSQRAERHTPATLLERSAWLDIPILYDNNKRAIITVEKGAMGQEGFADQFSVWLEEGSSTLQGTEIGPK